ncbi:ROK family protein, partial [Streptomyces sp. G35A]
QALAAAIAATIAMVELDLVVIGGGVAQAGDTLFAPLRRRMEEYAVLDFARGVPVVPAELELDAGLIGAAAAAAGPVTGAGHSDGDAGHRRAAGAGPLAGGQPSRGVAGTRGDLTGDPDPVVAGVRP